MARTYTKLMVSLSTDADFLKLSERAKYVYLMLLAQPKLSSAGCIPYQPTKWVKWSTDSTLETVARAIGELQAASFVYVDDDTEELLIRSFIRHDGGYKNPKMRVAVESAIAAIESDALRDVAATVLANALVERQYGFDRIDDAIADAIETGTKPEPNSSLQPASLHTADGSQQPHVDPWEVPAAAAALEMYLEHRRNNSNVTTPAAWTRKVRAETRVEFAQKCADYLTDDCDPADVLTHVFGLNELDTFRLTGQTRKGA